MSTIDQVLTLGNCQYSIYDMGRVIRRIDKQTFIAFEQGAAPYPFPIQGHACFAVVFAKPEQAQTPYLWLLKLPLDEISNVVFAARDDFLRMVIEALGNDIANAEIDTETLNNHAYALKPTTEKLAVLNAKIRHKLHQPASIYYESAYQYFTQQPTESGWQALGLQGIADLTERLDEPTSALIAKHIQQLPEPAFRALAQCLEHSTLSASIQQALLNMPNEQQDTFWLRALTGAQTKPLQTMVEQLVASTTSLDMIITVCARHWPLLNTPEHIQQLLEAVVRLPQGEHVFASLVADLSAIPECRASTLSAIRLPSRSPQLATAIGKLFAQTRSSQN